MIPVCDCGTASSAEFSIASIGMETSAAQRGPSALESSGDHCDNHARSVEKRASPIGLGRFSTLRAWLSQWSIDDTNADGPKCARSISVPLLAIENSADDAVPQPHARIIHDAAASRDKTFKVIKGATHYYQGQPELLKQAVDLCVGWMDKQKLLD